MDKNLIYMDTYVLQQDMRIRLPKSVLANLNLEKGISKFDIYFNTQEKELVLRIHDSSEEDK